MLRTLPKAMALLCTLFVVLSFTPNEVQAAEAIMGIKVRILQCGSQETMQNMCEQDSRCCPFVQKTTPLLHDASFAPETRNQQHTRKDNKQGRRYDLYTGAKNLKTQVIYE
jgi:hypothetical protein